MNKDEALKKLTEKLKVCIIIHSETQEVWKASSGKWHWGSKGHAKQAWAYRRCNYRSDVPYFDDQSEYEILEIDVTKSIEYFADKE